MIGTGFIGIRGKDESPESGLYIQDLEGVNISLAAATADEEVVQGITLLRQIEAFSQKKLIKDFLFKLGKYLQFNSITHSERSGYVDQDVNIIPQESTYKGVEVSRTCPDRFSKIYIEYIEFFASKAASKILFIQDGLIAPAERVIDVKLGLNRIRLDYTATNEVVRVFMNFCDLNVQKIVSGCGSCGTCSSCSGCPALIVKGVEGYPSWVDSDDHNGLVVATAIKGDEEELINLCRKELEFPALYAYGANLMKYVLRSNRINPMVRNGKDDAKQNLIHWMGGFSEDTEREEKGEYWRCLGQAVEQSRVNLKTLQTKTFDCNVFQIVDSIP